MDPTLPAYECRTGCPSFSLPMPASPVDSLRRRPFRSPGRTRVLPALMGVAASIALVGPFTPAATAQEPDDDPARRWEFFIQQRRFPGTDRLGVRLQAARMEVLTRSRLTLAPSGAAVLGGTWMPLGPERIPWFGAAAGRVSDIELHPGDPDILYVGGAQGGVWRSDDGGASWRSLTDQECSLAMGSIAIDPVNPDIVYAGTGEQHFSGDSYYGCGILRSTDGGESWTRLGASVFGGPRGGARISRLLIDPATAGTTASTVLWAATSLGLYRSADSGGSWTEVRDGYATDLVMDPDDPSVLYAAFFRDGVYGSVDGGFTWTRQVLPGAPPGVGRINLAIAPSDGDVVYAAVADGETFDGELLGIWRTMGPEHVWMQRPAVGGGCAPQCWYDLTLAVHPTDPDVLYFGGVALYRSDDGAGSFVRIGSPIHVDQHMLTVDPRRPDWLWVGNDGGVYRSTDRGATWTTLNTNLSLTQFYGGVSIAPTGMARVLGGTQDNGTVEYEGTPEWAILLGGDGGHTAIHPLADVRWMETQWGGPYSGPRRAASGGVPEQRINGIDLDEDAVFIPPLVMDPFDPEVLYFGARTLYRTGDEGIVWEPVGTDFGGAPITAIGPSRSDADVVYVGTAGAGVWSTTDGGRSWRDGSTRLPRRYVTDVAVHPRHAGTAWATVSGFGSGHVFVTRDFGASWADVTGDLPDHPVNAILLDPADPERVYIGTDLGVFTAAGGGTWMRFGDGLPMVAVFDLAAEPDAGVLVAGTHGRGAFSLPVSAPLELQIRETGVRGTVVGGEGPATGRVAVGVFGAGWPDARWSVAGGGAEWLTLTDPAGVGRSSFGWRMESGGLWPGSYEGSATVSLEGGEEGPRARGPANVVLDPVPVGEGALVGEAGAAVEVGFTLELKGTHTAHVDAPVQLVEAPEGSEELVMDSMDVALEGPDPAGTSWVVRVDAEAPWFTLVDSAATGPGRARWTLDPTGLAAGEYTVPLRVGGTTVEPVPFAAVLTVAEPLAVTVGASGGGVITFEGTGEVFHDSVDVALTGYRAVESRWTARHGRAPWLVLVDSTAVGDGPVRWTVDATGVSEGVHVDTLTVVGKGPDGPDGEGDAPPSVVFVDTLVVRTPVGVGVAASDLLDGDALDAVEREILDRLGNRNGGWDLGDFLAWVERCRGGGVACPTGAPAPGGGP